MLLELLRSSPLPFYHTNIISAVEHIPSTVIVWMSDYLQCILGINTLGAVGRILLIVIKNNAVKKWHHRRV